MLIGTAVPIVSIIALLIRSAAGATGGAVVAYVILATFFGGVTLGVVAMVAIAVRREDRLYSLSGAEPRAAAHGMRWLTRFCGADSHLWPGGWT
jgi:hypothetical protein